MAAPVRMCLPGRISKEVREASLKALAKVTEEVHALQSRVSALRVVFCVLFPPSQPLASSSTHAHLRARLWLSLLRGLLWLVPFSWAQGQAKQRVRSIRKDAVDALKDAKSACLPARL
jgi:hypothetical protein